MVLITWHSAPTADGAQVPKRVAEAYVMFELIKNEHLDGVINGVPVPVALRSKSWPCGFSPAGIVGSNPTGGMNVCLLWVLFIVR